VIKVLIVDDQRLIREGIKCIIEQDHDLKAVGLSKNWEEALKNCEAYLPNVVLMYADGIDAVRAIKEKYNHIKVIVFTKYNDDEKIIKALDNGVDGYMLKDSNPEELIMAIKSAAIGLKIMHNKTFCSITRQLNKHNKALIIKKEFQNVSLSEKEVSIIRSIVEGKDNSEIASTFFLSEGTIRNIVSGILRKLNMRDRIQLTVFVVKNDLV
jgi:DNA-binding NarL/FixJ family response regulator